MFIIIVKVKQHFKNNVSDGLLDKANERLEKENIKANTRTHVFPELVNKASEQREKEDIKHNFRQAIGPELLDEHSKYQEKQDVNSLCIPEILFKTLFYFAFQRK